MKFSITSLLATTFLAAGALATYATVPTLTASIILLAPLPTLAIALLWRDVRTQRRLVALLAMPFFLMFYIGIIGPLTALAIMPEKWGMVRARSEIPRIMNGAYPIEYLDSLGGPLATMLQNYQLGWASLVDPELFDEN